MALATNLALDDDPFHAIPTEIVMKILEYVARPDDFLHLCLASPSVRIRFSHLLDSTPCTKKYILALSLPPEVSEYPVVSLLVDTDFALEEDLFQNAVRNIIFWPCVVVYGRVVLVVTPDAHINEAFAQYLEGTLKAECITWISVHRSGGFMSKEEIAQLRKLNTVAVVVTHRTGGTLPRPTKAIFISPRGALPVADIMHTGPRSVNVIWPVNDGVGRNYTHLQRMLAYYDRTGKQPVVSLSKPIVVACPEGSVMSDFRSLYANHHSADGGV